MIMAIVGSALLLVLSLLVVQAVIATIRPSDNNEASFRALAAAEAGVAEYQARLSLAGDPDNIQSTGAGDPLDGWVRLGADSIQPAYFTYRVVDDSTIGEGRVKIQSSGRVGAIVRTVDAVLAERSSLDYGYVSGAETLPTDYPDIWNPSDEEVCGSAWYEPVGTTQAHRNSNDCTYYAITSADRFVGNAHTNDVWYFEDPIAFTDAEGVNVVFDGVVTSSCPDGQIAVYDGFDQNVDLRVSGGGCPPQHRWIDVEDLGNNTSYQGIEIPSSGLSLDWNPEFDTVLEFPSTLKDLRDRAARNDPNDWGCTFTGPTRIRFGADPAPPASSLIYITSPDTLDDATNIQCRQGIDGLQSYTASNPRPTSAKQMDEFTDQTIVLDYDAMVANGFNGAIFVADWPDQVQDPPTCPAVYQGQALSPYVIPSAGDDAASVAFPPSRRPWKAEPYGFPINTTKGTDPWSNGELGTCSSGTVYVEGAYSGKISVGADASIAVTGQLWNADLRDEEGVAWCGVDFATPCDVDGLDADGAYGVPPAWSENALALVPGGQERPATVYVYLPEANQRGAWNNDALPNINSLIIDAAMIIRNGCFGVSDYSLAGVPELNLLKIVGSLAQSNRCPVRFKDTEGNSNNGYKSFSIYYDERLSLGLTPPGVTDLFREPFRIVRISEVNPNLVTDLPEFP
jgi:hypothetical protein